MSKRIDTLPMHLGLALTNWMTCGGVWQIANGGLPGSNPSPAAMAHPQQKPQQKKSRLSPKRQALAAQDALISVQNLLQQLEPPPVSPSRKRSGGRKPSPSGKSEEAAFNDYLTLLRHPDFMAAIQAEAHRRATAMLEGLKEYQEIGLEIEASPHEAIWEKGAARLLDYGTGDEDIALLCIPSLINKHYILDLYPERSLVAYLAAHGIRPLVVDWGTPGVREKAYDCADYVHYTLRDAFAAARRAHRGALLVMGYCMGGVLALALAQLEKPDGLALLATPWDYAAPDMPPLPLDAASRQSYADVLLAQDTVPPVWTQTLFHLLNPWHFQEKFRRFPQMPEEEQNHFVAVESWVNDGVPLARKVAKECFIDWPYENKLGAGRWRVGSQRIDPRRIACPTFIATPMQDRIVPPGCSRALIPLLANATAIAPDCGHVSMVVGEKAKPRLWQPLVRWIQTVAMSQRSTTRAGH